MAIKKHDLSELREIRCQWYSIPIEAIPESKRKVFEQRREAVDLYIDGVKLSEIFEKTNIDPRLISRYVDKCVKQDADGNYAGYSALIKSKKIVETVEGKFGKLLSKYPALNEYIAGCWYGDPKYTLEKNINLKSLHDRFIKKCIEIGVPDYEYPFNTVHKGYVSLSKYVKKLDAIKVEKAAKRESKDNMQKLLSTGFGNRYTANPVVPFSTVQIDGHIIDMVYNVEIYNEDGTVDHVIATRAWVLAVIDVATRCVLSYSVSQEFNYNQYDVLDALKNAIVPKERPKITIEGLEYPENGGYYQTAFPDLEYALFDTVMLDNAKSHLAFNTVEKMTDYLKCSVNFGSVATPETRGIVERFFGSLETRGFHRLPATTGSNIKDLKRRDPEKAALKYDITYDEIVQLLDVLIAEYNNTPHSALNNLTPLECMRKRIFDNGMYPTIADKTIKEKVERLNYLVEKRTVRGGNNGKRAYINYEGAEYRSYELSGTGIFIGKEITLLVDPRDVSEIEAYTEDGSFIGKLRAKGEFGTKSHSLKTRRNARKLAKERSMDKLDFNPAISAYEQSLNQKGKNSRRDATKADIVRREIGRSKPSEIAEQKEADPTPIIPIVPVTENIDPEEYYQSVWGKKQ